MSDDEIKLVTSLAGDKSWSPLWPDDPYAVQEVLTRPHTDSEPYEENAADAGPLYFQVEEITMFLRQFCYWNDLCPKYSELRHWLPILSQKHIKLCDLTPQAWGHIIQTETVRRLTQ